MAFLDSTDQPRAKGWWPAATGACVVNVPRGSRPVYYVYVMSLMAQSALKVEGAPSITLCISRKKFEDDFTKHYSPAKNCYCTSAGLEARKFIKIKSRPEAKDRLTLQSDGMMKLLDQASVVTPAPPALQTPVPSTQTPEAC